MMGQCVLSQIIWLYARLRRCAKILSAAVHRLGEAASMGKAGCLFRSESATDLHHQDRVWQEDEFTEYIIPRYVPPADRQMKVPEPESGGLLCVEERCITS